MINYVMLLFIYLVVVAAFVLFQLKLFFEEAKLAHLD